MLTDEEAISLIEKLRRAQPNNRELWRLLDDHELRIYSKPPVKTIFQKVECAGLRGAAEVAKQQLAGTLKTTPCPTCEKRKANKAASMKKWRDKNPKPKHDRYAG